MSEYNVRLRVESFVNVTVDADSMEDAEETALSVCVDEIIDELEDFEFEIASVEEV